MASKPPKYVKSYQISNSVLDSTWNDSIFMYLGLEIPDWTFVHICCGAAELQGLKNTRF